MSQDRSFTFELKNDQTITLKFSPIEATGDRLWQMFATTEALDIVEQLIKPNTPIETGSVKKTSFVKQTPIVSKNKKK